MGAVRGRSRACVRAARPGPLSGQARTTDRGRARPPRSSRDLRSARRGAGARGDGRAPAGGNRAQFLEAIAVHDAVEEIIVVRPRRAGRSRHGGSRADSRSDSRARGRRWTGVDDSGIRDRLLRTQWTYMDCSGRLLRDRRSVGCGFESHPRSKIYLEKWVDLNPRGSPSGADLAAGARRRFRHGRVGPGSGRACPHEEEAFIRPVAAPSRCLAVRPAATRSRCVQSRPRASS